MSKKAQVKVKKSRRRLKRSIRRSLAAVLMITAIGIAAIPVPENAAATDAPADEAMGGIMELAAAEIPPYYLGDYDFDGSAEKPYPTPTLTPGSFEYTFDIDNNQHMQWQFKIKGGELVGYNSAYLSSMSGSLIISGEVPTNYDYVKYSEYQTWATAPHNLTSENYQQEDVSKFFDTCFHDVYAEFTRRMGAGESVDDITIMGRTASESDKPLEYYCILERSDLPAGYVLESITIQENEMESDAIKQISNVLLESPTGDNGSYSVYIPKYNGSDRDSQRIDAKGYHLAYDGSGYTAKAINAIGDYAFAGNNVLSKVELPESLSVIGKGAFMGCGRLDSVKIPYVLTVSDAAFKGCALLRTVDWEALSTIGKEAFYGTGISGNIEIPNGVNVIDDAAFYGCTSLNNIGFETGSNVTINPYAFYNNSALNTVSFQNVAKLGNYCFAVDNGGGDAMDTFTFPASQNFELGTKILANRSTSLRHIIVPTIVNQNLGNDFLDGCTVLQDVLFQGSGASYNEGLFKDVMTSNFYVQGPARTDLVEERDDLTQRSNPRVSTWDAGQTGAGNDIPYKYRINNRWYYEICNKDTHFLMSIEEETRTLLSCNIDPRVGIDTINPGPLIIPDKVGTVDVERIDSNCFNGSLVPQKATGLVIGDNIKEIEDSVFRSWEALTAVRIGRSVQKIGNEAFAGCTALEEVEFATPANSGNHELGSNTFATGSGKLTIYGDIVPGYGPFDYAMDPKNDLQPVNSLNKSRILYQSRWDSPVKHMSVMYAEGLGATLVDYPLMEDADKGLDEEIDQELDEAIRAQLKEELKAERENAAKNIVVPAGVQSIDFATFYSDSENQGNYNRYFGPLTRVDKDGLFHGNEEIETIDMSGSYVLSIPDYAFESCTNMKRLSFPQICEKTGKLPFKDCPALTELISESVDVPAQNGILYQKNGDTTDYELVECIQQRGIQGNGGIIGTSGIIPEMGGTDTYFNMISSIGEGAFENCDGITVVEFNGANNLTAIPDSCFKDCDGLESVSLPESVTAIGREAFADIRETEKAPRLLLTIRSRIAQISGTTFGSMAKPPETSTVNLVNVLTYEGSAPETFVKELQREGYDIRLGETDNAEHTNPSYLNITKRVYFIDYNGKSLCDPVYLEKDKTKSEKAIFEDEIPEEALKTVKEENHYLGHEFTGWVGWTDEGDILNFGDTIPGDYATYQAQYEDDGTMVNGSHWVEFADVFGKTLIGPGIDLSDNRYHINHGESFRENNIPAPDTGSYDGYTFTGWYPDWSVDTPINGNMTIVAMFLPDNSNNNEPGSSSGSSTQTSSSSSSTQTPSSGSSTQTSSSGSSTQTPSSGSSTQTPSSSSSTQTSSSNTTSGSSTSDSNSSTSTTSSSTEAAGLYTLLVVNGSGSGSYAAGTTVIITANTPATGQVFNRWTTETEGVTFTSTSLPATTIVMPSSNATVTAEYGAGSGAAALSTSTAGGNGTGTPVGSINNGNTRIDITKPGISNKDLATATVNGSTDNFVVKISETSAATQAVANALTNKYGSLENILYYAMDISLYDSTGTTMIPDITGLTVDITIPIPDALVAYGGNNMAGAVVSDQTVTDQLEDLGVRFSTINGIPCVSFTATHFSPYTIYVDTSNLVAGMLDVTPKTGDPIHPKWFLSVGLACLSIILFIKKDKRVALKNA